MRARRPALFPLLKSPATALPRGLTFAPGVTSLTVTVPIVGDTQAESNEAFRLVLGRSISS